MGEQLRFIMMVGLAGSGKSTVAHELMEGVDNIDYHSSDAIREEVHGDANVQDNPTNIFQIMEDRTKESLKAGRHVIYDATNLSRKKRKHLLSQLPKNLDIEKIAVYVATPIKEVLRRNASRDRVVPEEVIADKMYKTLQIPIYSEGFDKIIFEYDNDTIEDDLPKQFTDAIRAEVLFNRDGYELITFLAQYFDEFVPIYDLSQDSKYHSFSVSRHIYYVYRHVLENYQGEDVEVMLWTALLHDIGKAFCKSFKNRNGDETRYANFIGHEYVGSQIAVPFLKRMNFSDEFIHKVATLIQFHMYLLDANANKDKLRDRVGEDTYKQLEFLRDADTLAH
jgi:putative nucleotidyltransferase with HDIG domain